MPAQGQRMPTPQGGYPGQVPQGYYPNQGYATQGQAPQGYAPQGRVPQGQMPQGQMPQGQMPQGQAPYGYPQGGYYGTNAGYQGQGGYYAPQGAPVQGRPMPPQGYAQQPYPPQQGYGQGYPGQPYPGPYGQPAQPKAPAKPFPVELVSKIVLFGVLPLLFLAGMVFSLAVLKWIFIVLAVAGVAFLWIKPMFFSNTRLTLSAVYAAAAVVALVSALMTAPVDAQNNPANSDPNSQAAIDETLSNMMSQTGDTPEPGMALQEVTPSPTPALNNEEAVSQLKSFFYFWSVNKTSEMVSLCAPSWQSSVDDPTKELFVILANRVPKEYEVEKITGSASDSSCTATVVATIDKLYGGDPSKYRFSVIMLKENDVWYVDPKSLSTNEELDTPTPSPTASPSPTPAVDASTLLYYNEDGGQYYHLDPNCSSLADKYKPLKSSFTYAQLNAGEHSDLRPCNYCGAPFAAE